MYTRKIVVMVGGAAFVLGLGVWITTRSTLSTERNAALHSASAVSPAYSPPAQAVAVVPDGKSTTRPSIISPKGSIVTNGKPFEQVCMQYWAEIYGFELTNEELVRAQEAYNFITSARRQLEDRIAKVQRVEPTHFKIVIPAYPEEGEKLKQQFGAALESVLGTARSARFLSKIEAPMSRDNFGWGMVDQILDVTLRNSIPGGVMEIAHGFALPDSGIASNVTGVSVSKLPPDDLSIYSHLGHYFPKQSAN